MAERSGTITNVETPKEGTKQPFKYTIKTPDNKELKITAWPRVSGGGDEWIDNPAANLQVGQSGKFTGEIKEESYDGNNIKRFYANGFQLGEVSSNGSSPGASSSQGSSSDTRDASASFALSYAKDLCVGFVAIGHFKDEKELMASWGNLADFALEWLKQNA